MYRELRVSLAERLSFETISVLMSRRSGKYITHGIARKINRSLAKAIRLHEDFFSGHRISCGARSALPSSKLME